MQAATSSSSMGPVLFVGLTALALMSQGEPEITYADPARTMAGQAFDEAPGLSPVAPTATITVPVTALTAVNLVALRGELAAASGLDSGPPPASTLAQPSAQIQITVQRTMVSAAELDLAPPQDVAGFEAVTNTASKGLFQAAPDPVFPGLAPPVARQSGQLSLEARLQDTRESLLPNLPGRFRRPSPAQTGPDPSKMQKDTPFRPDTTRLQASINADFVHFRAGPGTRSAILGRYDQGAQVELLELRGNWARVRVDGQTGWVFRRYLDVP